MIKENKRFGKKDLLAFGIALVSSFAILFVASSQSQYASAQNPQPMHEEEMNFTNQTNGHDMGKTDMDMMNMMMSMMDKMNMMMSMMMSMSSGESSNSSSMNMSNPAIHGKGGSNMSMMVPQ